ncbi:hypothetical protein FRC08_011172 [Ceratobasidium sp. 394]|nr:hypothetical protein FRC08_011172 [Ceratobasidium sp. 394]
MTTTIAKIRLDVPVECLPDTVLSSIFVLLCRSWDATDAGWRGIGQQRVPYVLASVSRRWRAVALSTSRLWEYVDLSLLSELLATHLARSKSVPIDVDLGSRKAINVDTQESLRILGETRNWARVRYLDATLGFEPPIVTNRVIDALNSAIDANPADALESIHITVQDRRDTTGIEPEKLHLHVPQSQALETIDLHGISLFRLPLSPLPRLECLRLADVYVSLPNLLLPLLELTPNLETLSLGGCRFQFEPGSSSIPRPKHSILLSKLSTLRLDGTGGLGGLNTMFQALDMPNLRVLSFSTYSNRLSATIDWNAVRRCNALQSLTLAGLSSECLMGLLSHIDVLVQLELISLYPSRYSTPDDFVRQLARRLLETSNCPMLVDLNICFPLHKGSMGIIEELGGARPSLWVYVEPDEPEYEEDDAESEGGLSEAGDGD